MRHLNPDLKTRPIFGNRSRVSGAPFPVVIQFLLSIELLEQKAFDFNTLSRLFFTFLDWTRTIMKTCDTYTLNPEP